MLNFREASLLFIGPDPGIGVSGGNIFNQRLLKSLSDLGLSLASLDDWPEVLPNKLKHLIVDSLYFNSVDRLDDISGKAKPVKWFLLHHLTSMFPPSGITSDEYFHQFEKAVLDRFDRFLVTSNFSRAYLEKRGIDADDIRVLTPFPPPGIKISSKEHEIPRVLILGNLIKRKGLVPFLETLTQIESKPRFELVIFGRDDIEMDYARDCIGQVQRLPGARYAGVVPPIGTVDLWPEFDILVSPAYMETFGMSLQEARYAGLVRLAVDGGYARHHLQAGAEDLVAKKPEELAEKLITLLRNPARLSKYRKEAIKEAKMLPEPEKQWVEQLKKFKSEL